MKNKNFTSVIKLKTVTFITLAAWCVSCFAQVNTMYVMKNGVVVFQSPVSGVDQVTFDEAAPGEALIVHKNNGSPDDKTLLNNIQQLSLSDENLSVKTSSGSEVYALDDIAQLLFDGVTTGINNPLVQSNLDVLVSITPEGDVMVESPVAIKSLALFSVDGRMISTTVETLHATSLRNVPAGVYLLRVETEQGTAFKKVVKPLNK